MPDRSARVPSSARVPGVAHPWSTGKGLQFRLSFKNNPVGHDKTSSESL